jgi:hypothetical protein
MTLPSDTFNKCAVSRYRNESDKCFASAALCRSLRRSTCLIARATISITVRSSVVVVVVVVVVDDGVVGVDGVVGGGVDVIVDVVKDIVDC